MNKKEESLPYDPETLRRIQNHPCFSQEARHLFGRCHVAVAPICNIQCNYCIRDFDCVNESRPGVSSEILTPETALKRIDAVVSKMQHIRVVGIAGPGDPLANQETFETLRLVHEKYPDIILCISTNGVLLSDKIDELERYNVRNITVTLNAIDASIGEKIYTFVEYQGKRYTGREAAELLLNRQIQGIAEAVKRGMLVKINTVYIPGINDKHIPEIAKKVGAMGVFNFNIIPLIPQYKFKNINPPTPQEKIHMHELCAPYVRQMRHCQRCRADAVGMLGKDVQNQFSSDSVGSGGGCSGKHDGSGGGCSGKHDGSGGGCSGKHDGYREK